jgi:hypothetical protein
MRRFLILLLVAVVAFVLYSLLPPGLAFGLAIVAGIALMLWTERSYDETEALDRQRQRQNEEDLES